ncbi:MAG TPA: hypothetical protein VGM80_06505 [Gaiellaceae bacterium]|jgi:hypothetical protein
MIEGDSMIGAEVNVELARHQWEEGRRAVDRARRDRPRWQQLIREVDVVTACLTRRVGQVFTLEELATAYEGADRWVLEEIHEAFPDLVPVEASTVASAAFDAYSRRASDYAP